MASNMHPKMDRAERAKQFMPFDALKGFREALAEKERVIIPPKELSKEWEAELDDKLHRIQRMDIVTAKYYQNGEYVRVTGAVSAIDKRNRILKIADKNILFDEICDLQDENFMQ